MVVQSFFGRINQELRSRQETSCPQASDSSAYTVTFINRRGKIPGWRRWRPQDSAAPYHDWNERICAECYATNGAARIVNNKNQIQRIVNNYARISFNFGPTLLSWLKENAPRAYRKILDGERRSRKSYGDHSSAMAQVYNHIIMPLASTRDRITQIRWGIADYMRHYGAPPEGMWLAETAADMRIAGVARRSTASSSQCWRRTSASAFAR